MAEGLVLKEQRALVRRELIYYLKVTDRKTGLELGRLGDIHAEGMLVFSEQPLAIGGSYQAALELPKALAADLELQSLPFQGQSVWTRPGPKMNNYFESGLRFINSTPRVLMVIGRLIDIFAMPGQ